MLSICGWNLFLPLHVCFLYLLLKVPLPLYLYTPLSTFLHLYLSTPLYASTPLYPSLHLYTFLPLSKLIYRIMINLGLEQKYSKN